MYIQLLSDNNLSGSGRRHTSFYKNKNNKEDKQEINN